MVVLDVSRFTPTKQARVLWSCCRDGVKYLVALLFGFACLILLLLMHPCTSRGVVKGNDEQEDTSRDEAGDLESQTGHAVAGSEPQRRSSEEMRGDNKPSHADGDERLSIVKRTQEIGVHEASEPADTGDGASSKAPDKKTDHGLPVDTSASDGEGIIIAARKIELRTTHEIEGTNARAGQGSMNAGPARQQLLGVSPKRLAVTTTRGEAEEQVGVVKVESQDYNVSSTEPRRKSEANNVTRGTNDENRESQLATSVTFESETARYFFLNRTDVYTEKEIIGWTASLNSRINSLSAHLINELTKVSPDSNREVGDEPRMSELVKRSLGARLYTELVETRGVSSTDDASASIHDSLDAWQTSCIHLAMKPMLFGFSLRTAEEINEVLRQMTRCEPDLAQCWNQIRSIHSQRIDNQVIQTLIHDICPFQHTGLIDTRSCAILEYIYQRNLITAEQGRQVAMHWRALLHKHELGLASYTAAIKRTEELLSRGILHIFTLAGFVLPRPERFRDRVEKIVKEAATLAERVNTGVFSQTIETVVVEPGSAFDKHRMKPAEEGDSDEVKCTIQLGLHGNDPEGQGRYLLVPEVLLV